MPILRVTRALEYGLITIFDGGVSEDLPEFDANAAPVFFFQTTMTVAAQNEIDGDVLIQIAVDESCDVSRTPIEKGSGDMQMPTGRLRVSTASWVNEDSLDIPVGRYNVQVLTSAGEEPEFVSVLMQRIGTIPA